MWKLNAFSPKFVHLLLNYSVTDLQHFIRKCYMIADYQSLNSDGKILQVSVYSVTAVTFGSGINWRVDRRESIRNSQNFPTSHGHCQISAVLEAPQHLQLQRQPQALKGPQAIGRTFWKIKLWFSFITRNFWIYSLQQWTLSLDW